MTRRSEFMVEKHGGFQRICGVKDGEENHRTVLPFWIQCSRYTVWFFFLFSPYYEAYLKCWYNTLLWWWNSSCSSCQTQHSAHGADWIIYVWINDWINKWPAVISCLLKQNLFHFWLLCLKILKCLNVCITGLAAPVNKSNVVVRGHQNISIKPIIVSTPLDTNCLLWDLSSCRYYLQPKSNRPVLVDQELIKLMIRWSSGHDCGWSFRIVDLQEQGCDHCATHLSLKLSRSTISCCIVSH